jgi:hypothetical protein
MSSFPGAYPWHDITTSCIVEQLLNGVDVGTALVQVRGAGMAIG